MNRKRGLSVTVILGLIGAVIMIGASPALAHEERTVGAYHFAVGFGDEPAYTGQKNSVQLILAGPNDKPVVDLGDTVKVEVGFGDQHMDLTLEPNFEVGEFGTPGDYRAWFFPTRPGAYTFHFTGSIKGQNVDESFTSSPTTFSEVVDPSQVEFPAKDPTTAQLSERIDREVPRLNAAVESARTSAKDEASSAKTIGYIGIGLGVVGIVLAGIALVMARRRSITDSRPASAQVSARST